jgi:outer membrane lipoprotein SlyB
VYGPTRDYSPAQVAAAPRPVCSDCGVVENFREIEVKGKATPLGMIAGGVAGALLGNQFGRGTGKTVMTVAGAAGGAFAGNVVEKKVRAEKKLEITVRMDDGSVRTLTQTTANAWRVGDHVRIVNNQVIADS